MYKNFSLKSGIKQSLNRRYLKEAAIDLLLAVAVLLIGCSITTTIINWPLIK